MFVHVCFCGSPLTTDVCDDTHTDSKSENITSHTVKVGKKHAINASFSKRQADEHSFTQRY